MSDIDMPTEEEIDEMLREIEAEKEQWDPLDLPESQERLALDLKSAGAPDVMIENVGMGVYHDYVSPHPLPKHILAAEAKSHGLEEIAFRAREGHYDP